MHKEAREELRFRFKLLILELAAHFGPTKTCRDFEVPSSTFYEWKKAFKRDGVAGLKRKKPIAFSHPRKVSQDVVDKVLHIRRNYQLGPERIMWYLERYHGVNISESSVYRILKRHKVNRLSKTAPRRAIHTKRYAKSVPGHHVQMDVKFLTFKDEEGRKIRRFQYTAIDDAT